MGLQQLKTELKKYDKETLIKHISELYKKYKPVKEYFDFYINPNENELLKTYKEKVLEGFYPKRGYNLNLSIARKAINDFKKLGTSQESYIDLLLYYVECGIEFTNDYGDINESFYLSLEKTFSNAMRLLEKENLHDKFKSKVEKLLDKTANIGWGFPECVYDIYYQYFPIDE